MQLDPDLQPFSDKSNMQTVVLRINEFVYSAMIMIIIHTFLYRRKVLTSEAVL